MKEIILNNRGNTIREVADDVGMSFGSLQAIFTDVLRIKRAAARFGDSTISRTQVQLWYNWALRKAEEMSMMMRDLVAQTRQQCLNCWRCLFVTSFDLFEQILIDFERLKFCNFGTIFAAVCFMPKTSVKISWHEPNYMSTLSATSLIVIWR